MVKEHVKFNHLHQANFLLQFFDLRKELVSGNKVKITAQGLSMYPQVRPGDTLHVESRNARDVDLGSVVIFRHNNRVIAHRAIEKGVLGGRDYIVARADRGSGSTEGPFFDEDLIGVVTHVERKNKILDITETRSHALSAVLSNVTLGAYRLKRRGITLLMPVIRQVQGTPTYRRLAEFLFAPERVKMDITIRAPFDLGPTGMWYREISPDGWSDWVKTRRNGGKMPEGRLVASINGRYAGHLNFRSDFVHTRIRYAGTGVKEALLKKRDEINKVFS